MSAMLKQMLKQRSSPQQALEDITPPRQGQEELTQAIRKRWAEARKRRAKAERHAEKRLRRLARTRRWRRDSSEVSASMLPGNRAAAAFASSWDPSTAPAFVAVSNHLRHPLSGPFPV